MKIIFLCLACMFTLSAFAQAPANVKTKEYYLTKSRHQRTIAWVMLGGGVALTTIGIVVTQTSAIDEALGSSHKNNAGPVLGVIGAASVIGSIPFFINASHNKKKAASLSASVERIPELYFTGTIAVAQPAVTFRIPL